MTPTVELICGDALDVLRTLPDASVDAVVTDPPYGLVEPRSGASGCRPGTAAQKASRKGGFMGKKWDANVPGVPLWRAVLRTLKPGGYMLSFGGTRTYHRLACAVEDAGFQIRDCLMWLYATGFPKGKGCLKPAYEPILLCRKPGKRVLPLGIDECRVPSAVDAGWCKTKGNGSKFIGNTCNGGEVYPEKLESFTASPGGRWPANLVHDGSDEVLEAFAAFGERPGGTGKRDTRSTQANGNCYGLKDYAARHRRGEHYGDTGTAARFFYCAKASRKEREAGCEGLPPHRSEDISGGAGTKHPKADAYQTRKPDGVRNHHPTVKPLTLMRWLVRLVCPPGGIVLDPFAGSFTTALACLEEGRSFIGIEQEEAYLQIGQKRVADWYARQAANATAQSRLEPVLS